MMNLTTLPPGSTPTANVVTRKVFINGTELSGEVLLLHLSVFKAFNKIASAKLIFRDGDVAGRTFSLSNDDQFRPGAKIKIQLGYERSPETVFEGIIVRHNIKLKGDGISHLFIEAKNKAVLLTGARKNKNFINKKDSEVIEEISEASALPCEVPDTGQANKQLVQYDATDWDFMVTRAEANGMLVFTDDDKIIFLKPDAEQPPDVSAIYGANLLEFEGEMDARRQYKSVTAKTWDFSSQQLEVSEPGAATYDENGNLSSAELGEVLGANKELRHTGRIDPVQLQDWADAYALRSKMAKAAGKLKLQGNAAVKPGTTIALEGVGDRFNGSVLVTGVKHTYNGDWLSEVQFGWTEDPFYKKEDVMDQPAAGLLPGILGLQIGVVVKLENDPDSEARIKVRLPIVDTDNEGIWARIASLDAGNNRGFFFRPEIGDEVIVSFLNDDPREPVVLGMLNSSAKPAPLEAEDANNIKAYVSRSKLKLTFDDEKKSIKLETPGGRNIFLDDESGVIQLKDGNGNSIVMNNSGIHIQSQANVVIKGQLVQIN